MLYTLCSTADKQLFNRIYTLSSHLLVPPNTIFVTDHTIHYFVNVLPDWQIVILSLECYIAICIDWLYAHFTALCMFRMWKCILTSVSVNNTLAPSATSLCRLPPPPHAYTVIWYKNMTAATDSLRISAKNNSLKHPSPQSPQSSKWQ